MTESLKHLMSIMMKPEVSMERKINITAREINLTFDEPSKLKRYTRTLPRGGEDVLS